MCSSDLAVLLGDEIMIAEPGSPSGIAQLARVFEETHQSTVAVMEVAPSEVSKYGIVKVSEKGPNLWSVLDVVEKPEVGTAPSHLALPGRYVFAGGIFDDLRQTRPGRGGEIQLTDAMTQLARREGMLATVIQNAQRFDAGDKLGYLMANVELALRHPQVGAAFERYLRQRFGGT